jgi:hypothetical protein
MSGGAAASRLPSRFTWFHLITCPGEAYLWNISIFSSSQSSDFKGKTRYAFEKFLQPSCIFIMDRQSMVSFLLYLFPAFLAMILMIPTFILFYYISLLIVFCPGQRLVLCHTMIYFCFTPSTYILNPETRASENDISFT